MHVETGLETSRHLDPCRVVPAERQVEASHHALVRLEIDDRSVQQRLQRRIDAQLRIQLRSQHGVARGLAVRNVPVVVSGERDDERLPHLVDADKRTVTVCQGIGLNRAMIDEVVGEIEKSGTTLVFTNTRSQAELWYQALLQAKPDWAGEIALHHGSLDREVRDYVERGLKLGTLRAVVATSSLDLGVDFSPVERVLQIGSPKGVARLLQRAGRSGHAPGQASRITCVPSHAFEFIEAAAARRAAMAKKIESRRLIEKPLDVLVQHLVTIAAGEGFTDAEMLAEVRTSYAYRDLTDGEWYWILDFITKGGEALRAYPEYRKVECVAGVYRVTDPTIARRHRMSIGTIVSDAAMDVRYLNGSRLGHVEESFIARLSPGDAFTFAGRALELIRIKDMTAFVKPAKSIKKLIPRWAGGKMPLSSELARAVRELLQDFREGRADEPEMAAVARLLRVQKAVSRIPDTHELLFEQIESREGHHIYC